jgi:hypothetical protein
MNTLTWKIPTARPPGLAPAPVTLTLPVGATQTLRGCAGALLEVTSGRLWITEPGDPDDHFLSRGDTRRLCGNGPVVLQSDGACAAALRIVRRHERL